CLILFCLLRPPTPPTSLLFPYTTLFRSPLIDGFARIRGGSREEPGAKTGLVDVYGEVWRTGGIKTQTGDQLDDFLEAHAAKVETDRKSTRLNSSHRTISYAVFCLKKKRN